MASLNIPQTIADYANASGVDPNVALELATVESSLNQNAVSSAGAIGIMQLLPSSFPGVNIQDAETNIRTGVSYIAQLLAEFNGDYQAALAAYNWGPSRVATAQGTYGSGWFPTIPTSVQNYVNTILANAGSQYTASVPIDTSIPAAMIPPDDSGDNSGDQSAADFAAVYAPAPVAAAAAGGISMQMVLIGLAILVGGVFVFNLAESD